MSVFPPCERLVGALLVFETRKVPRDAEFYTPREQSAISLLDTSQHGRLIAPNARNRHCFHTSRWAHKWEHWLRQTS